MKKIIPYFLFAVMVASFAVPSFSSQTKEKVLVLSFDGKVDIIPPGEAVPAKCRKGLEITEGTEIITGEKAYVDLAFDGEGANKVRVREKSTVVVKLLGNEKIELIDGEAFFLLKNMKEGSTFEVKTPAAVCGASGTGWMIKVGGGETLAVVFEDSIYVIVADGGEARKYEVKSGSQIVIDHLNGDVVLAEVPAGRYNTYLNNFLDAMYNKDAIDNKIKILNSIDEFRESQTDRIDRRKEKVDEKRRPEERSGGKYKTIGS